MKNMGVLLPIIYILGLYSACAAGFTFLKTRSAKSLQALEGVVFEQSPATLLLMLFVGIPTTLQFFFPEMLSIYERDSARFLNGDWWRLITPLFVQDGGVGGAIFNLISLLLVGTVAEQLCGSKRVFVIFLIGGIIGEIVAFGWQPIGAGNSVANFSLAAGLSVAILTRRSPLRAQIAALFALGADAVLVALQDIHGAGGAAGAILALVLCRREGI